MQHKMIPRIQIGTFTKNTHLQPKFCVIIPPITGPIAADSPCVTPKIASATCLFANGIADTPITILVGNKIAAPTLCIKREKIRKSPVLAKAQSTDPPPKLSNQEYTSLLSQKYQLSVLAE